jgi:hypothetical protein
MASLQKKYIAQAKKTVSSSQWKKRGLKTAWRLQRKAKGTRKGQVRKTARRAFSKARNPSPNKRRNRNMSKVKIPHISVTGAASGLLIANFMNEGYGAGGTVLGHLAKGNFSAALNALMVYVPALITTPKGQQIMVKSIAVATAGSLVRKLAGNPKLGGTRLYFRV